MKRALIVLLMILGPLVCAETYIRITAGPDQRRGFKTFYQINGLWLKDKQDDPLIIPFDVYADVDFKNDARLHEIYEKTKLPAGKTLKSWDFLRFEEFKEHTAWSAHINALGFRGEEVKPEKKKGVYRIIALGDYHPFGHGVRDDETYPAQLERELNRRAGKTRYEVWNGGRQASSAIVGLARLKNDIFKYHPDMLIFDYGFIDWCILKDNYIPVQFFFPKRGAYNLARRAFQWTFPILARSVLFQAAFNRITELAAPTNIANFDAVISEMLRISAEHHLPVILVDTVSNGTPPEIYQNHASREVGVLHAEDVFFSQEPPTDKEYEDFLADPYNWLGPRKLTAKLRKEHPMAPYHLSPEQMSPLGHRVLAKHLADLVLQLQGK